MASAFASCLLPLYLRFRKGWGQSVRSSVIQGDTPMFIYKPSRRLKHLVEASRGDSNTGKNSFKARRMLLESYEETWEQNTNFVHGRFNDPSNISEKRVPPEVLTEKRVPTEVSTEKRVPTEVSTENRVPTEVSTEKRVPTEVSTEKLLPTEISAEQRLATKISKAKSLPENSGSDEISIEKQVPPENTTCQSKCDDPVIRKKEVVHGEFPIKDSRPWKSSEDLYLPREEFGRKETTEISYQDKGDMLMPLTEDDLFSRVTVKTDCHEMPTEIKDQGAVEVIPDMDLWEYSADEIEEMCGTKDDDSIVLEERKINESMARSITEVNFTEAELGEQVRYGLEVVEPSGVPMEKFESQQKHEQREDEEDIEDEHIYSAVPFRPSPSLSAHKHIAKKDGFFSNDTSSSIADGGINRRFTGICSSLMPKETFCSSEEGLEEIKGNNMSASVVDSAYQNYLDNMLKQ